MKYTKKKKEYRHVRVIKLKRNTGLYIIKTIPELININFIYCINYLVIDLVLLKVRVYNHHTKLNYHKLLHDTSTHFNIICIYKINK